MNNPELFKSSAVSVTDSVVFIKQFEKIYEWKDDKIFLDVGCGIGNVTKNIIIPALPKNFDKLIAVDVSEEMIKFAKKENSAPKIEYMQMDVAGSIPKDFEHKFDCIFSFYCLHWVENQRFVKLKHIPVRISFTSSVPYTSNNVAYSISHYSCSDDGSIDGVQNV